MSVDVVVIGAGVAGLACARELASNGAAVAVVDCAAEVGGRCSTRRFEGQPVDHGVVFLHGRSPEFIGSIETVEGATLLPGWPERIHGYSPPCQAEAFAWGERRFAFAEGLGVYPEHLAAGLDVRLGGRVARIEPEGASLRLVLEGGAEARAGTVVVTLPVEQMLSFLDELPPLSTDLSAARQLLRMVGTLPCLTLIAGYPADGPCPSWDVGYCEDSSVILLISHDSAKRPAPRFRVLVFQGHARWSRENLEEPAERWAAEILGEAGRLLGSWAAAPIWATRHRWRHARTDRGSEFSAPLLLDLPGGARLGLAGEVFAPGGGVEAAWRSGTQLARRLLGKDPE